MSPTGEIRTEAVQPDALKSGSRINQQLGCAKTDPQKVKKQPRSVQQKFLFHSIVKTCFMKYCIEDEKWFIHSHY